MLYNFFDNFFLWDTWLHTISGFIFAFLGYKLLVIINRKIRTNKICVVMFCFCFSMTIGVLWEFVEFTSDLFLYTDMQKDRIVNNISSVELCGKNCKYPLMVKDIEYAIAYDSYNNELIRTNGYLDVGIIDTMKDLIVNFIGDVFFCIFLLLKRKNRH